ncbi:MAG: protein kinase [Verrucomicrobiia bacterium]
MNAEHERLKQILAEAASKATSAERAAYLDGACREDPELRSRVEALLGAHDLAGGFLEAPVVTLPQQTVVVSPPLTEKAGNRIGRYKLLQQIGEGGCGVVYMAEQEEPVRRRVALKVIKLGMDTRSVIARFEAERQALALMDHPNIAKVLDAGATETGRPFFVMELVRGIKITEYCDQNRLSTRERLDLFIQVCHAVQHAHQKGIIHRDLKPSNILVSLHDGVPVPVVIDFGIAKATEQRLTDKTLYTAFEQFIGTPAYMSPEQAEMSRLDIDTRSDIYSLGVLLYELLTGKTPFDPKTLLAAGLDEMRRTIREQEPTRPSTRLNTLQGEELTTTAKRRGTEAPRLVHLVRGDLDWIVMKCLEKDRTRRYETASGLAADIQRHLKHEPVVARPQSATYRVQKFVRRNKLTVGAAATVAAALVLGIVGSAWQAWRATQSEARAEAERQEAVQARTAETEQRLRADAQAEKATTSEQRSRRLLYASDMSMAQQALNLNDLGRARRLLDRHRPQPGQEDLPGWEWRYLWQLTRSSALITLTNRPVRGWSVSFSPDGTRLAVGWEDGHVDLWDVPGRRLLRMIADRATDQEHPYPGRVAFSPVRNLLAARTAPKEVTAYDLDSNEARLLWQAPGQGWWEVRELAWSKDGSRLVIYAGSGLRNLGDEVSVVHVASGKVEVRRTNDWSASIFLHHGAARLSPDNRWLYLARSDLVASRWDIRCIDLTTDREVWQSETRSDWGLTALDVSPDGRYLASGSGFEDATIRIWDATSGRLVMPLDGHSAFLSALAFSTNGQRLVSAATDQTIRIWDTATWTERQVLRGHTDEVHAVALAERGGLLASTGKDGNLILWEWREEKPGGLPGYGRLPAKPPLPFEDSRVLLWRRDDPPELLDLKSDNPPVALPELGPSRLILLSSDLIGRIVSPFGTNLLLRWNGTNQILVHEMRGTEFRQVGAIPLNSAARPAVACSHPKRRLVAWTERPPSTAVNLASLGAPDHRIQLTNDLPGLAELGFSDDGAYLWAATWEGGNPSAPNLRHLRAWHLESGQRVAAIYERVTAAAVVSEARRLVALVATNRDHQVVLYDLAQPPDEPRRFPGRFFAEQLSVSPDGNWVAVATYGGLVRLLDLVRGEELEPLHAHQNATAGVAFSPDGRRLISTWGGREGVKLWDVRTWQPLLTLASAGADLKVARWSAGGDVILAGPPWQAWRVPSWEEIAAAEAKDYGKNSPP